MQHSLQFEDNVSVSRTVKRIQSCLHLFIFSQEVNLDIFAVFSIDWMKRTSMVVHLPLDLECWCPPIIQHNIRLEGSHGKHIINWSNVSQSPLIVQFQISTNCTMVLGAV
ncbi:hypothetical protein TNCT_93721 [Trichonephila clavata]|uniref:Uncharacterized protein n=1 Tax=Trichonephila clavata TaxID=2740835 RepID=A0A8X6FPL5_TRICU|nr:hypothetical protein TNCT_93721 [Trichonephila clavata]